MGISRFISLCPLIMLGLSGCLGGGSDEKNLGRILGSDQVSGPPGPVPTDAPAPTGPGGGPSPQLGESCHSSDPARICLSLKYVAYQDSQGKAVVSEGETLQNLAQINKIWSQCDIGFEIGNYLPADPSQHGLSFNTPTSSELSSIRKEFVDSSTLLVVTTGTWSGSLGAGSANAWAAMPGGPPYGVVLEEPVGTYPNIIAHELGHYLNLGHVSDSSDVMSAIIYEGSTKLTASQCGAARSAAGYYWKAMQR